MQRIPTYLSWLFIVLVSLQTQTVYATEAEYRFIFSVLSSERYHIERAQKLCNYLSQQTQLNVMPVFVERYADMKQLLNNDNQAFGWSGTAMFARMHKSSNYQLLVVPVQDKRPSYYSYIITRKDRAEKKLEEFSGAAFAYADINSNSGYIAPAYQLLKKQIHITEFFRALVETGSHHNSILAVTAGLADVGAVDEHAYNLTTASHQEITESIKVIDKLGPFPFNPIITGNHHLTKEIMRIRDAFININNTSQGRSVLDLYQLDGFVIKPRTFYDGIVHMVRALENKEEP